MSGKSVIFFRQAGQGEPLLPLLASERRLIVPDWRGQGNSQGLPPRYSARQHAVDLPNLLDDLGIARAEVLGNSQGSTAVSP